MRSLRLLIPFLLFCLLLSGHCPVPAADLSSGTGKWKITTIRVCRDRSGYLIRSIDVYGPFPVYSFFIPRPVWTVNGTVVEAQPLYERGHLYAFRLLDATPLLRSGSKNTVKFSLPDQNSSKTFFYHDSKPPIGNCFDFF